MSEQRIVKITKDESNGDFQVHFAFGKTVRVRKETEDWDDIDDLLKYLSPSGIYELTEITSCETATAGGIIEHGC